MKFVFFLLWDQITNLNACVCIGLINEKRSLRYKLKCVFTKWKK